MKLKYRKIASIAAMSALALTTGGCDDYLDVTPPSDVSPEVYFLNADQLGAYTISYYATNNNVGSRGSNAFPHHGVGGSSYTTFMDDDKGTDNEDGTNDKFYAGDSKVLVGNNGGAWGFGMINNINYYIRIVVPKYENNEIQGAPEEVRHYIGEGYMLRAVEYFHKLCALGDFPIVKETLPMDKAVLTEKSKRAPRNKVARFILADLDSAINLLSDGASTGGRNRITRDVARLFKARVALYEATFEKYFAGTPFVPDAAAGWPGAKMDYNKDFTYDNAGEVQFFLDEALKEAKLVADTHPTLANNTKKMIGLASDASGFPANPYYDMFCTANPANIDEVLMFRSYDKDKGVGSCFNQYIRGGRGYTQEFANAFLMDNGLPIYADGSAYAGDDFVADTKVNRDWRWRLFMKAPNEYVYADNADMRIGCGKYNKKDAEFKAPAIVSGGVDFTTSTGYQKGKGFAINSEWSKGGWDYSAAICFRAAEAYLIYMEAAWEKYGDNLDSDAWAYWGKLRTRAGLPADARVTINATDLDKEEYYTHDFGLYSAGHRITSKVLYNIRRERRCEFMGEGMRWDDLIRWRALDQLKDKHFFKHGCKVFGPMLEWFTNKSKKDSTPKFLKWDQPNPNENNVSSPSDTEGGLNGDARYFSLMRLSPVSDFYQDGYSWHMAHYLEPIAEDHFVQTGGVGNSTIYQNPYWSETHDTPARQ